MLRNYKLFQKGKYFVYQKIILHFARKFNSNNSKKIPKYEIADKHIKNAKLITTREELLKFLPQNGVVAELGVDEGNFSQLILSINNPQKLHLIDFWGSKRYNQSKRKKVENRFLNHTESGNVEINIGLSTKVVENFKDNYFDWIYIDTDHSYKVTIEELELYRRKVKTDGIIAGHDYILGNWNRLVRYGVIEAVYEFCNKYDWEIIYLTTELKNNPSFAIRKINDDNK